MNFVQVFAVGYLYQLAVGYLAVYFVVVSFVAVAVSVDFVCQAVDYSAALGHLPVDLVVTADQGIHLQDLQDNLRAVLELELIDLKHLKQLFALDQRSLSFR